MSKKNLIFTSTKNIFLGRYLISGRISGRISGIRQNSVSGATLVKTRVGSPKYRRRRIGPKGTNECVKRTYINTGCTLDTSYYLGADFQKKKLLFISDWDSNSTYITAWTCFPTLSVSLCNTSTRFQEQKKQQILL